MSLDLDDFPLSYRLVVRDARGNEPPLTPRGRVSQATFESAGRTRMSVEPRLTVVPPHGAVEHGFRSAPERLWALVPGERYRLTLEYRSFAGSPVRGVSNTVEFVAHRLDPHPEPAAPDPVLDDPKGMRLDLSPIPVGERQGAKNYRLSFVNESRQAIRLHAAGFWTNHRVVLLDAQGQEPPLTEKGRAVREASTKNYGNRDHDVLRTILPGETLVETEWIDLEGMYRLEPGKYTLTAEYFEQIGDPLRIPSNPVEYVRP